MVCIICGHKTQVINSRHQKRSNNIWRRRQCTECLSIITTQEQVDISKTIRFETSKKLLVEFSEDTIFLSIHESLAHSQLAITDARALTNTVISKLLNDTQGSLIVDRTKVVSTVADTLKNYDIAAYVRYMAFYSPNTTPRLRK